MSSSDERDRTSPLPGGDGVPPIDFATFVLSIGTACRIQLGDLPDPFDGGSAVDLAQARSSLEILDLLDAKTRGNLSGEEDRMLSHQRNELRARYLVRWSEAKK